MGSGDVGLRAERPERDIHRGMPSMRPDTASETQPVTPHEVVPWCPGLPGLLRDAFMLLGALAMGLLPPDTSDPQSRSSPPRCTMPQRGQGTVDPNQPAKTRWKS